jgi:hypothetical protein
MHKPKARGRSAINNKNLGAPVLEGGEWPSLAPQTTANRALMEGTDFSKAQKIYFVAKARG